MSVKSKYTSPFTIHIIWHPSFKLGEKIADYLYSNFTRNVEEPLSRGIGIPVYFRSLPSQHFQKPQQIEISEAEYHALVILIDDNMFNDEVWNQYIDDLLPLATSKIRIYPIALSSNAYYLKEQKLGREQFISAILTNEILHDNEFKKLCMNLRSRLLHSFCRLLLGKKPLHEVDEEINVPAPIKLFISHAKKDGEADAEAFRNHVQAQTKLNTFFDANDIADGYKFDEQIKSAIENGHAALVVFHTDAYSTREWCQIEVLTAKRYKTPIVVVYNISKGENRSFPYLGNVPTIRLLNNFDEIIDLALYQILINVFHKMNLNQVKRLFLGKDLVSVELTSPPELFNFIDIQNQKRKLKAQKLLVIYPDPPIGIDEMQVLTDMDNGIDFFTPIQLSKLIR
jgi:hypothetical protein